MPERGVVGSSRLMERVELQGADRVAELLSERFAPVTIEVAGSPDHLTLSGIFGSIAGVELCRCRCSGEFRLVPQRVYDGVIFCFATAGSLVLHQSGDTLTSSPTIAIAAEGRACRSLEFQANYEFCGVAVSRPVMAERLSILLGYPMVNGPLFQPSIDMASDGAAALKAMVMCVTSAEFGLQLNRAPLAAERVRVALIDTIIEMWPHDHSDVLYRPRPIIAPWYVKLAIDFIHDHAQELPNGAELAALSGVSLRSLQASFRRFVGVSMGTYQRQVRLEGARMDLQRERAASVEDIALRWGFTNAGRFSRYFKAAYGSHPAELVRRSPGCGTTRLSPGKRRQTELKGAPRLPS